MLVQAAYEKNIDKLEELNRVVLANKDKFLLDVLYKNHITDKAVVTDAELKDFYDKLAYKVRPPRLCWSGSRQARILRNWPMTTV